MSDELEILEKIADECGFECHGVADSKKLVVRPEVRDMCAVGKCHVYGKSWACPPACGDIEEFDAMFKQHSMCFIVQSVGQLEDEFDFETMVETEQIHKERFFAFGDKLREAGLAGSVPAAPIPTNRAASPTSAWYPWKPLDWLWPKHAVWPVFPIITVTTR